jgi:hypothetical protein
MSRFVQYLSICVTAALSVPRVGFAQPVSAEASDWYVFEPTNTAEDGIIGMSDWLDAPAGKHGILKMDRDRFVFADGTPIKFWGTNNSSTRCAPEHAEAERRVDWYAKYGINAVRLHKFTYTQRSTWGWGHPDNSTLLTDEGWDRIDYYSAKLREKGIYYGWSHIFGHLPVEGDRDRILALDEIMESKRRNTLGLVNFARDLQDLNIELTVNMLNHRNPYTGLRYADDPALIFVELQNEDDIFWIMTHMQAMECPTYKKLLCGQFSEWLVAKYGSQETLVEAWGARGIDAFPEFQTGEHLDKRNLYPLPHHAYYSHQKIEESTVRRRLLDSQRFLYETQIDYYDRYVQAIRNTGYTGPLVGSCWMAGQGIPYYYNLYADYRVGIIDRHNYFAARPHRITPGPVPNDAMLDHAGLGLISSGLQQTKNRPFLLSEWISKMPNEWIMEGPAIIGVYGMGLQGWDGSYHFASSGPEYTKTIEAGGVYNTNNPTQLGLFPALARMIYRGDVSEGAVVQPNRKIHIPDLMHGNPDFYERVRQQADIKSIGGDVPVDALALGKVELEFVDQSIPNTLPDFTELKERRNVRSNTGELYWDYRDRGYFTVNTAGTKAVVGFAKGKSFDLGNVTIRMKSRFGAVFVTADGQSELLTSAKSILVTVMARARNSGMKYRYNVDETVLEKVGGAPVLMEPVQAVVTIDRLDTGAVHILDHDGLRTGRTTPLRDGRFVIDGSRHKTLYYEVSYE